MRLTESIGTIRPRPLQKGDTIGITAPSSQLSIKHVGNFAKAIEKRGFKVLLGETVTYMLDKDYNAGSPKERARDFNRMVEDPSVKAIWAGAGGFGAQTLAPHLDFAAIERNPKIIIGFSDTTFLLNAINHKTGLTTFLGPTGEVDAEADLKSLDNALAMLTGETEYPNLITNFDEALIRRVSSSDKQGVGKIIGGNITMMQTTLGTEWQHDTTGKIICLEEVGESSYSVERSLEHMRAGGMFDAPAAVVFGEFSKIIREPVENTHDSNPSINEILVKQFRNADYPVLIGYNFSHGNFNLCIPIGGVGKVSGESRTFEILTEPIR